MYHNEDDQWPEEPPIHWSIYFAVAVALLAGFIGICIGIHHFIQFLTNK